MERFGGYTYSSLMDEDAELLRLVAIQNRGRVEEVDDGESD